MKKILLTAILTFIGIHTAIAQVGIGTEAPDDSAQLELQSTTKGFLPPRMSAAERNEINNPAQGLMIYCTNCGTNGEAQLYNGTEWTTMTGGTTIFGCGDKVTFTYGGQSVTYGTIAGTGNNCWLDRNLGATVVTSKDRSNYSSEADYIVAEKASFGDLFQWGRAADGHQLRDPLSGTFDGAVTSGNEGNNFITNSPLPYDWLKNQDDDRWNTGTESAPIKTANDPCPSGYRVPTEAEWGAELDASNGITNAQSAFEILKLPMAGYRFGTNGSLAAVGTQGIYWSSTASSSDSRFLNFYRFTASMASYFRANGGSVRCIKE
jgi:uncharacterized protein (TIGR02145 family)